MVVNGAPHVKRTWHATHREGLSLSQKIADRIASTVGSWHFIIIQTSLVFLWIFVNVVGIVQHWDPYPFIFLNLIFGAEAAYTAPIIMMAQNRQNDRDRAQAEADYQTNIAAKEEIEELQASLIRIENEKLDEILKILQKRPSRV